MRYNAFITAGGLLTGTLKETAGTSVKALIKIGGFSMLERAVRALRESELIDKIALIAPREVEELPDRHGVDTFIEAHQSGVQNILRGLEYYRDDTRVVLASSDLPFIHGEAVSDFLERCPASALLCYPIFEKEEINPAIRPGVPSYIRLKDGSFTGGSLFLMDVRACLGKMSEIGKSFNARKSVPAMAFLLGPRVIMKFLTGQCTTGDLIHRVEQVLGGPCAAVRGCDPVITIDIDDEKAYRFACDYASRQK
jgi:hypothetical protein